MATKFIQLLHRFPLFILTAWGFVASCQAQSPAGHLPWTQAQLQQPKAKQILVVAHRGDWRNAPENSLQSLQFCIEKGFDIVECDLKISKDSQLIIMHDKTIDRTTTGSGLPENYSLQQLKTFRLKNATGHATQHTIPTLEEFLQASKGKIMVCIDKGFEYFDQAMDLVKKYGMENQVIYNVPCMPYHQLTAQGLRNMQDKLFINLLSFPQDTSQANILKASFTTRGNTIFHPIFASDSIALVNWLPTLKQHNIHLWLNALWPEHNGGHDDDKAVEAKMPNETWGWLVQHGATIIQTDRPEQLLAYLKSKGLHN